MYRRKQEQEGEVVRVRLPRGKELLGVVEEMVGASRFKIACKDGKLRTCRVPGSKKRYVWVRLGDIVLVEPWEIEPGEKGDVIFKYTITQAKWLKNKGFLNF